TTNDSFDAWFIGFSPDLVIGVYVGFDQPRTLGPKETGASVAAPIFTELMTAALKDTPAVPFRIPPGIRLMRVDAKTGRPAIGWESDAIIESFKPGDDPDASTPVLDGAQGPALRGLSGSDTNYNFDGIY
ncbi:MAG: penicillin-binding protein, partial [Dongiaceae bacterium]